MDKVNQLLKNMPHMFLSSNDMQKNIINEDFKQLQNEVFQQMQPIFLKKSHQHIPIAANVNTSQQQNTSIRKSELVNQSNNSFKLATSNKNPQDSQKASYNSSNILKNESLYGSLNELSSPQFPNEQNHFMKFNNNNSFNQDQDNQEDYQQNFIFTEEIFEDQFDIPLQQIEQPLSGLELENHFIQKQNEYNDTIFMKDEAKKQRELTHQFLMKTIKEQLDQLQTKTQQMEKECEQDNIEVQKVYEMSEKNQKELQQLLFERRTKILMDKVDATLKYKFQYDHTNNYEDPYANELNNDQINEINIINEKLDQMYQDNSILFHEISLLVKNCQEEDEQESSLYQSFNLNEVELKPKTSKKVLTKYNLDKSKFKSATVEQKPVKKQKNTQSIKEKTKVQMRALHK